MTVILPMRPDGSKGFESLHPTHRAPWELQIIPLLCLLIQAQEARIERLEQLDHQKALALDEQRRRAGRRAA